MVMTRESHRGHLINRAGLLVSSVYLSWTVAAKLIVENTTEEALRDKNIAYEKVFTTPSPFNSLLWRIVVRDKGGYYEAYYSVLDKGSNIRFRRYESNEKLLQGIEDNWAVQRLKWFSKGFYSVDLQQKDIVISDLRMGVEPQYVFRFKVGEISNPHAVPVKPIQLRTPWDLSFLEKIWRRIWDDSVTLAP
jgi:inner membrane protein